MRIIKVKAPHIIREYDGPARCIIAAVHGGHVWLVEQDHPEDDEGEMRRAANLIAEDHKQHAPRK